MSFRDETTSEWRSGDDVYHSLDPGFVHVRKIETILGPKGMSIVDEQINGLLADLPQWQKEVRLDHIYARTMLLWCRANKVRTLGDLLARCTGKIFCSNVELGPAVASAEGRVKSPVLMEGTSYKVELHYSARHIHGDTPRERLRDGGYTFSVIAELSRVDEDLLVFDPIVMGSPWLEGDENGPYSGICWFSEDFYEHFVEDFEEFAKLSSVPEPASPDEMEAISEAAVKTCLAEILGDAKANDWGGEASDYYSTHLRIAGRRVTAAFLLKGPARFEPMGLNHLGKNNDQIVRLADEPAEVLIVQHCHDVLPSVRKTLRAFAVQPSRPRRYCVIDGRDTLRLLKAYGLYEKAIALSQK